MEPSPLTQQTRPETFTPKVNQLYETLFSSDEELEHSEGFWRELFLLKPDPAQMTRILNHMSADHLLHIQHTTNQLFARATVSVKLGAAPSDEIALETLTVFLGAVLSKRYTNPSSEIISVLAGLDNADAVLANFVGTVDNVIRNGRNMDVRKKAVLTALSMTSGAYQTGLISYFTHRDLFPALMKLVADSEDPSQSLHPFYLLGLLVNYNRFEFQNPYRLRLDDFVNEATIKKLVLCTGQTCFTSRDKYVAVQEDLPEGWTLGSTLSYFGLGSLTPGSRPSTPTPSADEAKSLFANLPGPETGVLLGAYDFASANKLFCFNLVSMKPDVKMESSPLGGLLSFSSYLFQHAHRSIRTAAYSHLSLFIIHVLVEDHSLAKILCSEESKMTVRLCRQRAPYLPHVKGDRTAASVVVDLVVDGINHNLRRKLDVQFYLLCVGVLLRVISFLSKTRTRMAYHWSELWRSLLSFVKFLTAYAEDIKGLARRVDLVDGVVNLIALSLSVGETFLPDPASYDDLFYKLVESGDTLTKFRDCYDLAKRKTSESIGTLISVSRHYQTLLQSEDRGKMKNKPLSSKEVSKVIKQGYDTLSIQAREGLDQWEKFRDADHRVALKKIARIAVDDAKGLVDGK